MDYYEAKEYAGEIGRLSGFGMFCVLMVVMISLSAGIPPAYVWLACGLVGLATYALSSILVRSWAGMRIDAEAPVVEPDVTPFPLDVQPEPLLWYEDGIDWPGLLRYLQQPNPQLSRSALAGAGVVSQRAYSPVNGEQGFPERMVEIGAAMRINSGGGPPSYVWTTEAQGIIHRGIVQRHTSPTPPNGITSLSL